MLTQAVQTELSSLYATDEFGKQNSASQFTVAAKDDKPVLPSGQILTDLRSRYNDIVSLSEVPSLVNSSGTFFAVADKNCAIHCIVYYDGKGYYGVFYKDDGAITAYNKDELTSYDIHNTT